MAKIKRKKIKLKLFPFLIAIILIFLLYLLINYLLTLKIKTIYIYNNSILSDQEIIDISGLDNYPSFVKTTSLKIEKKLKSNPIIKDVKVTKTIFFEVKIDVEEYRPLFININNKVVLENKEEIDNKISLPILLNNIDSEIYDDFINKMNRINNDVLEEISEIKYDPSEYDVKRFLFFMKDGNHVYITLTKLDNINYYLEIFPTLNNKKGTLYLDSGNHFEVFK